jgi:hypothetical protein
MAEATHPRYHRNFCHEKAREFTKKEGEFGDAFRASSCLFVAIGLQGWEMLFVVMAANYWRV